MKTISVKFREQILTLSCDDEAQVLELKSKVDSTLRELYPGGSDLSKVGNVKMLYLIALRLSYEVQQLSRKCKDLEDARNQKSMDAKMDDLSMSFKDVMECTTQEIEMLASKIARE